MVDQQQQLILSEFAFFSMPFIGHTQYYPQFLKKLQTKYKIDVYLDSNYGKKCFKDCYTNYFELKLLDLFAPNEQASPKVVDLVGLMQAGGAYYFKIIDKLIEEIDKIWTNLNQKPKYIISDHYCRHGEVLARKYNIPHIVGFGTFWVYDYPEDKRDQLIEMICNGMKVVPPIDNKFEDKDALQKVALKYDPKVYGRMRYWNDMNVNQADLFLGFIHPCLYQIPFEWDTSELLGDYKKTPRVVIGPSVRKQDATADQDLLLKMKQFQQIIFFSLGSGLSIDLVFAEYLKAFNQLTNLNKDLLILMKVSTEFLNETQKLNQKINEQIILRHFFPQIQVLQNAHIFITHCGMNSISEALIHSVPMMMIPKGTDGYLTAQQLEKLGFGVYLKQNQETCENIVKVLRELLETQKLEKIKQKLDENLQKYKSFEPEENFMKEIEKFISEKQQKQQ